MKVNGVSRKVTTITYSNKVQPGLNSALAREVAAHGSRRAVQHGRRGQMLAPVHTCADGIALPLRVARGLARAGDMAPPVATGIDIERVVR